MKEEKICVPYKVILKKLWGYSQMGVMKVSCAREVLTRNVRFGSENWNYIYMEMKKKGYITYHGRRVGIKIQVPLKDLV